MRTRSVTHVFDLLPHDVVRSSGGSLTGWHQCWRRSPMSGSREKVRHIIELQLWEISLVTFAANPDARITQVHNRGGLSIAQQVAAFERMPSARCCKRSRVSTRS